MSNSATLTPVSGYALITPDTTTEKPIGIIINQQEQPAYTRGTIHKIGKPFITKDGETINAPGGPGDVVRYSASPLETVIEHGKIYHLVRFSAIVGVYK